MSGPGIVLDCIQRSPEWRDIRCGKITASRCADVVATIKKGEAAPRRNYRGELIAEILTGIPADHYNARQMEWGSMQEPFARAAYEMESDVLVETPGFILHPDIARFGCSPDGLVGDDGMVQIKCPNTSTHLGWMLAGEIPLEHAWQMLAELSCTGREWSDFVSFDPRLPRHLQLFVRRFTCAGQEHLIAQLETEVVKFSAEIEDVVARLPQAGPQLVAELIDFVPRDEMEV